jgi:hypothetical protein
MSERGYNATPKNKLLTDLMNSNLSKNETEWAAMEHIEKLNECIDDLQQKLLASQASEVRLREALNAVRDAFDKGGNVTSEENNALAKADLALSTPPNTADLDKYVESEIDKRLGEPVAWISINRVSEDKTLGYGKVTSHYDETLYSHTPLYAKKG